jgi:superfamily I DNA/RNA helicase
VENENGEEKSLIAEKSVNRGLKGWSESDVAEVQELVRVARGLFQVDLALTGLLRSVVAPFAETFREFFVREGLLSFDGLLMRARNLVRDQPAVREQLKRQYARS